MSLGSWMRNHPHFLEKVYRLTERTVIGLDPVFNKLGYDRMNRWLKGPEDLAKQVVFDCRMCGQCVLHSTGMTCPMSCPKNLRNGPCGGVRSNGHCEVKPEMRCVWVEAFERSGHMPVYGHEMLFINPPVNRQLEGSSAWVNMLTGVDKEVPKAWAGTSQRVELILPAEGWSTGQ